jgi:serine/threonine protein kinase
VIICPSCQTVYDDHSTRFCGRCGSDLGRGEMAPTGSNALIDPMIGRIIDGRYRVLARIGQGGMGAVYKVEHLAMGKLAAMKALHPSLTQDKEVAQRFRREAEAVSRLSSPHTVQVFDFGESGGSSYLVMELVKGEDLGAILRRDGPLPFARLAPMMIQVCDALSEAHEAGIVHRDLKPENLLVARARDGHDVAKVVDFGLAKLRDQEELNAVTARGSLVGTPFYMSPEQIRAEELDARSDLYSLGALMYRVLTGVHPFTAPTPVAVLTQHLTEELIPPSQRKPELNIAPRVEAIVMRAMKKRRDERFASADELRQALATAASAASQRLPLPTGEQRRSSDREEPSGVTPVDAPLPLRREDFDQYERGLKRRRWLALSIVPVALLLSVVAAVIYTRATTTGEVRDGEREPNDRPVEANRIASGRPIKGQIGKRLSLEESDRDFFVFSVAAPSLLRVELSGLPNMELVLEVFDGNGNKVAEANNGGVGDGERIPNLGLTAGEHYIAVRQVWVAGQPATENVSDDYTLTATWQPRPADVEAEPDDSPDEALTLTPGAQLRGYLGHAEDVDYYRVVADGAPGPFSAEVSGVPGVELRVTLLPKTAPNATTAGPLPAGGKVFDGGGEGKSVTVPGVQAGQLLRIERKLPDAARSGAGHDGSAHPPVHTSDHRKDARWAAGIDTPYLLSLKVKP